MSVKLTKHMLKINGDKYFRGGAHRLKLGTIGRKRDPIGANAYLDDERDLDPDIIEDYIDGKVPVLDIDFGKFSQSQIGGNGAIKVFGLKFQAGANFSYSSAKKAKLKIANFSLSGSELKHLINADRPAFNYMKNEGSDARVVSEVWVVLEASLASKVKSASKVKVGGKLDDNNKVDISFKSRSGKTTTLTISKGTVFAYKMHKVRDYDKRRKKARRITALVSDSKGMG